MPTATSYTNKMRYLAIAKDVKVQLPGGVSNTFRPGLSDMCSDFKTTSPEITATTGGIITTFAGTGFLGGSTDELFAQSARMYSPNSIITDSKGNIFFIDFENHTQESVIVKINANDIVNRTGASIVSTNKFKCLTIHETDEETTIYVCNRTAIYKLIPEGSRYGLSAALYSPTSEVEELSSISFDKQTNTFLASSVVNGGIYRITINYANTPPTATTAVFATITSTINPEEKPITLDSAGNLYVASSRYQGAGFGRRQVYSVTKFNSTGDIEFRVDCGFFPMPAFFSAFPRLYLTGITVGPDGNIYVSNGFYDTITRIDSETRDIATFAGGGALPPFSGDGGLAIESNLNTPTGIVFDVKSNLLICDTNNSRIRKVTPLVTTTIPGKTTYNPPWFAPVEYIEICNCKINVPVSANTPIAVYDGL